MATATDIQTLKGKVSGVPDVYTDEQLSDIIDAQTSIAAAAAYIWETYASSTAALVNVSESGSSRSLGDIHKNALSISKYYRDQHNSNQPTATNRARTRPITRD